MPKKKKSVKKRTSVKSRAVKKSKPDQTIAIVALVINIIFPGLGSLIGGKTKEGIWQLILLFGSFFIGILIMLTIVEFIIGGLLIIFGPLAAWIWGIITGAQLIQESQK